MTQTISPANRTCRDCGATKPNNLDNFCKGRNLCKPCASLRETVRMAAKRKTHLDIPKAAKMISHPVSTSINFDDRQSLDQYVKSELEESLGYLNNLIRENATRLKAAQDSDGSQSKAIDEATKALQRSLDSKIGTLTTLIQKLQLLDEMRIKAEATKPVTFTLMQPADVQSPEIVESRLAPVE